MIALPQTCVSRHAMLNEFFGESHGNSFSTWDAVEIYGAEADVIVVLELLNQVHLFIATQ